LRTFSPPAGRGPARGAAPRHRADPSNRPATAAATAPRAPPLPPPSYTAEPGPRPLAAQMRLPRDENGLTSKGFGFGNKRPRGAGPAGDACHADPGAPAAGRGGGAGRRPSRPDPAAKFGGGGSGCARVQGSLMKTGGFVSGGHHPLSARPDRSESRGRCVVADRIRFGVGGGAREAPPLPGGAQAGAGVEGARRLEAIPMPRPVAAAALQRAASRSASMPLRNTSPALRPAAAPRRSHSPDRGGRAVRGRGG